MKEIKSASTLFKEAVEYQLHTLGLSTTSPELKDTPDRVLNMWKELFSGYTTPVSSVITTFPNTNGYDSIVLLKDIEMYSMCEHHMLPFIGTAHVAYIPDKELLGVSKLARVLEVYARRLQIQERIGQQVCDALELHLRPKGCACIIDASHLCMRMRGCNKQSSRMITSTLRGAFYDKAEAREELLNLIK